MMVNMVLAASFAHPEYPTPFYDLGYTERLVETSLVNSQREKVSLDLILNRPATASALLVEVKSGMNDEARERFVHQLERHRNTTWEDVITTSGITSSASGTGEFDFLIFVPLGLAFEIEEKLRASDPHVCFESDLVEMQGTIALAGWHHAIGTLRDSDLEESLTQQLDDPIPIPDHYLPFDDNSAPEEIAAEIWPYLATRYIDENESSVHESWLAERAIPIWDGLGRDFQAAITTRVRGVLTTISRARGRPKINLDNRQRAWSFDESPEERRNLVLATLGVELMRSFGVEQAQLDVFVDEE